MGRYFVRVLLLRAFGIVLLAAFASAWCQYRWLLGDNGITPVNSFLDKLHPPRASLDEGASFSPIALLQDALRDATGISVGDITTRPGERLPLQVFQQVPTLAWFIPRASLDTTMEALSLGCTLVSALIAITGACAAPAMLVLWAMYLSLTSVGQDWYSFGWEMQLCETAFLFIFVCPLWWQRFPQHDLPLSVTWLMRWLLVRIMLGNGLIKLRGDECWRDLTCMNYFYHTQPVPNPLAPTLHALPGWVHKTEVLLNHFIECVAPFFLLLPQPAASIGGALQIGFQFVLIVAGNFSFLNWLTLVPAIAALDDAHVRWMFSASTRALVASRRTLSRVPTRPAKHTDMVRRAVSYFTISVRIALHVALVLGLGYLSLSVVENLVSPRQAMNRHFDWLRLVNTYGNFGSVTRERNEVIVEGRAVNGTWVEYEFRCKPGNLDRAPCIITPYHHRLDWMMWFAGFSDPTRTGWLLHLAHIMLLARDDMQAYAVLEHLMATPPFRPPATKDSGARRPEANDDARPAGPVEIRMTQYTYEFNTKGQGGKKPMRGADVEIGRWWRRKKVSQQYLPPMTLDSLNRVAEHYRPKKLRR
jgi:hypothetical protein